MIGRFLDDLFTKAQNTGAFDEFELIRAYRSGVVKYPIEKPYITFSTESIKTDTILLGAEGGGVLSEVLTVTVTTDEKNGGAFCEEMTGYVCALLMELDSEKNIYSVSVEKCVYDKSIFGYRGVIKFKLNETALIFGGE